jgi:hypothetical protein
MGTFVDSQERVFTGRCKLQETENNQERDAPPGGNVLMEQILENMTRTDWDEVLRRIACSPHIRRGKVLYIRHQIAQGTYKIEDQVDGAIDRVLLWEHCE